MRSLHSPVLPIFLACVAVWSTLPATAGARTFHVSLHGSNTPPYDTYAKAAREVVDAMKAASGYGDTILVHAGVYDIDTTLDIPIGASWKGVGRDSVSLIWRGGRSNHLMASSRGDNEVSGLTFINPESAADPALEGIASYLHTLSFRLHDCRFDQSNVSIGSVSLAEIVNNELVVWNGEAVTMTGHGSVWIHNNMIHGGPPGFGSGTGIRATEGNVLIEHNMFDFTTTGGRGTLVLVDRFPEPMTVRNNLFLGGRVAIIWDYCSGTVENNTVIGQRGTDGVISGFQDGTDTLVIRNNAFVDVATLPAFGNACRDCVPTGPITYTHNAFWPPVDSFHGYLFAPPERVRIRDSANFNAFPMFVGDSTYRLQWGSPLIDAGDPAIVDADGSRSDIGWTGGPGGQTYAYPQLPPLAPDSIWVTGSVGSRVIHVSWSLRPEADLGGYRLYRGDRSGFWSPGLMPVRTLLPLDTSAADTVWTGNGSYFYVVTAFDTAGLKSGPSPEGLFLVTRVADDPAAPPLPLTPYIVRTYPNPSNAAFVLEVFIPDVGAQPTQVTITIYNAVGQVAGTAYDGALPPGRHSLPWEAVSAGGTPLVSGVYFARLKVWGREFGAATKLVIVR